MPALIEDRLRDRAPSVTPEGRPIVRGGEPDEELTLAQQIVRGSALSTAGGILGGAVGSLPPVMALTGGVVNPITGTMFGSGAGEAITQYFDPLKSGIEDPSLVQIGLATGLPMVPALARRFFMSLPGAAAGLHEFAMKRLGGWGEKVISKFAPSPGTASSLFKQASRQTKQSMVVPSSLDKAATTVESEIAKSSFSNAPARRMITAVNKLAGRNPELPGIYRSVPFDEFRINQSDLGSIVRSLEKSGGRGWGQAKLLYGAMWDDIEKSAAGGSKTLKEAVQAFKLEEAAKFIKNAFVRARSHKAGILQVSHDSILTRLDHNRDVLLKLMPTEDIDDIVSIIKKYAKIPPIAGGGQVGVSSTPFAHRVLFGGLFASGAEAVGMGTPGGMIGSAMTGVLIVEAISTLLSTRIGRTFIRTLADRGMSLDRIANIALQTSRVAVSKKINISGKTERD